MNIIGNIIYFLVGGFLPGLLLMVFGLLLCITIVGAPAGVKCIQRGFSMFMPFGASIEPAEDTHNKGYVVLDTVWLILFGWILVIVHLLLGIVLMVTIIGIPFGLQHFKMIPVTAMPMSHHLVHCHCEKKKPVRKRAKKSKKETTSKK